MCDVKGQLSLATYIVTSSSSIFVTLIWATFFRFLGMDVYLVEDIQIVT